MPTNPVTIIDPDTGDVIGPYEASDVSQVRDQNGSPSAGSGSAVSVDQGDFRSDAEVFYDVDASTDDIIVEVSHDGTFGGEEHQHPATVASGNVATGGDIISIDTTFQHIRVYAGSSFSDSDVNELDLVARAT